MPRLILFPILCLLSMIYVVIVIRCMSEEFGNLFMPNYVLDNR